MGSPLYTRTRRPAKVSPCRPRRTGWTPVLWIRIRKFWLDLNPNPKKNLDSDTDSDPDTVVNENWCEKSKIKHLKEKTLCFSVEKHFFLWCTGSKTHMKAIRGTI
jgi:hypothetical protein